MEGAGHMDPGWEFTDADRRVLEEVRDVLPSQVFDAHAHVSGSDSPWAPAGLPKDERQADLSAWRRHVGALVADSELVGGLFMPTCHPVEGRDALACLDAANTFLVGQLDTAATAYGHVSVAPAYDRARVLDYLGHPRVVGFKPYHTWSDVTPTWDAPLRSFLPEWVWALADERGLNITLHLVRDRAIAHPDNQHEIRRMCLRYPHARLVLAHAARCFHAPNAAGVRALRGLENVWFDVSAICEASPIVAILREFGPTKVLWGSDFPVSEIRGRCVTLGDGFAWVQWDTLDWQSSHVQARGVLAGIEGLRALREASETFGLDGQDMADIFCDNALRLLGIAETRAATTQALYRHAKHRIPGGTQLLSKRPEMMAPDQWPAYFREARGCEVWDLDGRHYYDMSTNSVGACLLGYGDPDVTRAVRRRIHLGSISSLNPPEEVALADRLCEIHPWADHVRFVRGGGEAVAVAVRIARATTDRSVVAVCGYHGWHDWYLAANLGDVDALRGHLLPGLDPIGVPRELRGTTLPFRYNHPEELQTILDRHGDRLAAVVMEPCRHHDPDPGFLEFVRDGAHRCGALLVFDEVSVGWRLVHGGAHLRFGVAPDIAAFAKALGNGHPIGAVIGTRDAMEGAHQSFISSTYWTEGVGPAAALATLDKMSVHDVPGHVARIGARIQECWRSLAGKHRLPLGVTDGYPCFAHFAFDHPQADALRTLFSQWMLTEGFLAGGAVYPTLAHTDDIVDRYAEATDRVFARVADVLVRGDVDSALTGPVAHAGFRRLV